MPGSLTIGRVALTGLAPVTLDQRDRFARLVEGVDARALSGQLVRRLGVDGDERVIVLDRLSLEIEGLADPNPDHLSALIAEGIAVAVARLGQGGFARSCTFASPAHRRAACVLALSRGEAHDRWWFADLLPSAALPLSSAIRVVLGPEPLAVLAALAPVERAAIVGRLSNIDADLVFAQIMPGLLPDIDPDDFAQAVEWCFSAAALGRAQAILLGLAAKGDCSRGRPGLGTLAGLRLGLAIRQALGDAMTEASPLRLRLARAIASAIARGDATALLADLPDLTLADIAILPGLSGELRGMLVKQIDATARPVPEMAWSGYSEFGGLLMVWPHLPSLILPHDASEPGESAAIAALLGLAALAGRAAGDAVLQDEALRRALGVDPRLPLADLVDWLDSMPTASFGRAPPRRRHDAALPAVFQANRCRYRALIGWSLAGLARFARSLPGFGAAGLPFLRRNLLVAGAQVRVVEDGVTLRFERPTLDVVLAISGLADRRFERADGIPVCFERRR